MVWKRPQENEPVGEVGGGSLNLGLSEKDSPTVMAGASRVSSENYPNGLNRALFSCNQVWNQNMSDLEGCARPSRRALLCPALRPSHEESEREKT